MSRQSHFRPSTPPRRLDPEDRQLLGKPPAPTLREIADENNRRIAAGERPEFPRVSPAEDERHP